MARVTIEDCLEQVQSRFALVHLTVRRVLQLRRGQRSLVITPKNKEVVVALREIAAKKVTAENIRQIEEQELLSEAVAREKLHVTTQDVSEILEATTRRDMPLDLESEEISEEYEE